MNLSTLLGSVRKKNFAGTTIRPTRRRPRLEVDTLEAREVPATLPAPVINPLSFQPITGASVTDTGGGATGAGGAVSPTVVSDPTNGQSLVMANVFYTDAGRTTTRISLFESTDGGATWTNFATPTLGMDPKASSQFTTVQFTNVGDASVAFDRFGFVYVTYIEHNADNSAGRLVLRKYNTNGGAYSEVAIANNSDVNDNRIASLGHALYKWVDADAAYNPVVAVDNNLATFNDTNGSNNPANQADPFAAVQNTAAKVRVFVAWNTNNNQPANFTVNPNVIRMAASSNAGATFGAAVVVNDTGNGPVNSSVPRYAQPQILFTQGRAGVAGSGGNMITVFNDFSTTPGSVISDSVSFGAANAPNSLELVTTTRMSITDAAAGTNGGPDIPATTDYKIGQITAAQITGAITSMALSLNLHSDDLKNLSVTLILDSTNAATLPQPPNPLPAGAKQLALFNNATNAAGNSTNIGLQQGGTDMGLINPNVTNGFDGFSVGTIFQDLAPRRITDGSAAAPFTGTYHPEFGNLDTTFSASAVGTWWLRIVDNRNAGNTPPPQFIKDVTLKIEQNLTKLMGTDTTVVSPATVGTNLSAAKGSFTGTGYGVASAANPQGIGPSVTLATDNTLGAFSPYQNRVFMAYTANNGNVELVYSDDDGATWTFPQGVAGGFLPKLAVDPVTGTLGVAYYSTAWAPAGAPVTGDASGHRVATMFTTAVNQGDFNSGNPLEFAPPVWVNPTEHYQNQITSASLAFEPIPSNGAGMGSFGFGNNMGLVMNGGVVNLLYGGNFDANAAYIRTQQMTIAAGPRIVGGDSGPILAAASTTDANNNPLAYNIAFAGDGHREFDGFVVTFDRVVDPASFSAGDISLKYLAPTASPATGWVTVGSTLSITALDNITDPISGAPYGSKRFLVKLNTPQSAIGTYAYTVGPAIQDRVKSAANNSGNFMDQNQNAVTNEATDLFAVPFAAGGAIPFQLDTTGALPVIISGPYVVGTQIAGQTATPDNLVLNATNTSIDILFDRLMLNSSFTVAKILRMIGPLGDIPVTTTGFAVIPIGGLGGAPIGGTTSKAYRITFPKQSVSGYYQIQLSAGITDAAGNALDTNHNAGLANLTGALNGAPTDLKTYSAGAFTTAITAKNGSTLGGATINLSVADAYQVLHARANISLALASGGNVKNLDIRLVAPDGSSILLATNAPASGSSASMLNTTFDDNATTPVQLGGTFDNASFNPVQPLAGLNGHATNGTWKLVISNKGTTPGTVTGFKLLFDKARTGTGLGETISDQQSLSFHIFTANGSNKLALSNWTPIGPAGENPLYSAYTHPNFATDATDPTANTAGRVQAVAVDSSDPSGNTVYAAGASGGVWRTTNFMTTDPIGPTWIPLTDFGPQNSLNVGSIALYPDPNGDPQKTTILVGTGSEDANRVQKSEVNNQDLLFNGVGFLLSEDAGKSWHILDSSTNFNSATNQWYGVVATGTAFGIKTTTEAGTTVTVTLNSTPVPALVVGQTVVIAGNSVAGYNGTFVITTVNGAQFTYTANVTGLAAGSGGTAAGDTKDHMFVGATVNKVVFEPNPNTVTPFRAIMYAVVGQGTDPNANVAGLWRSVNGGYTWSQIYQGAVDDFAFAPASAQPNTNNRPSLAYMSVEAKGVYRTVDLYTNNPTFTLMVGANGRPTIDSNHPPGQTVTAPQTDPTGASGKIVLAVPNMVAGNALANIYYKNWVYALVANADGTLKGLYISKDAGANWTRLFTPPPNAPLTYFSNNGGQHSLAITIDPTNPNITYIASDALFRVDATFANDPYNMSLYQYHNADGGAYRNLTTGGARALNTALDDGITPNGESNSGLDANDYSQIDPAFLPAFVPNESFAPLTYFPGSIDGLDAELTTPGLLVPGFGTGTIASWNFLNLVRDPYNPFRSDTGLDTQNTFPAANTVNGFTNDGNNTNVHVSVIERYVDPATGAPVDTTKSTQLWDWVANMTTVVDPLTGTGRVIFGSDEGIGTFVNNADGGLTQIDGFAQPTSNLQFGDNLQAAPGAASAYGGAVTAGTNLEVYGKRNGNIQVARLYSGDVQPSLLAAGVAQSMTVAAARRYADVPVSTATVSSTGDAVYNNVGRPGRANAVATDKTGTGAIYILRRVGDSENPLQWAPVPADELFQVALQGGSPISRTNGLFDRGFAPWDNTVRVFAVNPIDPNGIILGSRDGHVYWTNDQGLNWQDISVDPSKNLLLDGSYTTAMAFGAPQTDTQTTPGLNDYVWVGTKGGKIFTKTDGGTRHGAGGWVDISAGLDGKEIQQIVPNPARGSDEAYAITSTGVFWMKDWTVAGAKWIDVTTQLKTTQALAFGQTTWSTNLVGPGTQTPQLLSLAVDWRPTYSPIPSQPILYVGGDAGVFRVIVNSADPSNPSKTTWAQYPNILNNGSVSNGGGMPTVKVTSLDLAIGNIDPNTGRSLTTAAPGTLVATTLGRGMWSIALGAPAGVSGPKIVSSTPNTPQTTPVSDVTVTFDQYIDATTFDKTDVKVTDPNGNVVPQNTYTVTDITPPPAAPGVNLHNIYDIHFAPALAADGTYTITVGPNVDNSFGTPMDQNSNGVNGEATDVYTFKVAIGTNDAADFADDLFTKLLGRLPTTAEYTGAANSPAGNNIFGTDIPTLLNSRFGPTTSQTAASTPLVIVAKSLITTDAARTVFINRLYDNGGAPNEIGNLLPGTAPTVGDLNTLLTGIKNGTQSPESAIIFVMTQVGIVGGNEKYYTDNSAGGTNNPAYMTKLFADLFKGTTLTFGTLPHGAATTWGTQEYFLTFATTAAKRSQLINYLVINGFSVTWNPGGGNQTTDFRSNLASLVFRQLLGRPATAAEASFWKAYMGYKAANNLSGSEWLKAQIMGSSEYFLLPAHGTQADGLPDDGLHTDRLWVEWVYLDAYKRAATQGTPASEVELGSQAVLDNVTFKNARIKLATDIVNSPEYRKAQITKYYRQVFGPTRTLSSTEMTTALNIQAQQGYQGLLAYILGYSNPDGSIANNGGEFYRANVPDWNNNAVPDTQKLTEWATAVYNVLLGGNPASAAEINFLVTGTPNTALGRYNASLKLLNATAPVDVANHNYTVRDTVIQAAFQNLLGRPAAANELTAYENYLKTYRWETMIVDITGGSTTATPTVNQQPTLVREFWQIAN